MSDTGQAFSRGEAGEGTTSHSVRVPEIIWDGAVRAADENKVVMNRLIIELLEGYVNGVYRLSPRATSRAQGSYEGGSVLRSVRVPTPIWDDARARAKNNGVVTNRLMVDLLEGFTKGSYRLPAVSTTVTRTYPAQPERVEAE
jgi:hypothetical protein